MMTIINFLYHSLRIGTPLLFGTTGEIMSEKSGHLNLGVEGMMAMGAIGGYYFACKTNSLIIGLLAAFLCAALGALLYAFLTITMQANQNVTGLALTIFGVGLYSYIGTFLQSNGFPVMQNHLQNMVAENGIPLLRDIPYIGKLLFSFNWLVYFAVLVAVLVWLYLEKTKTGLRTRAIGENPGAADACGVNVNLLKYFNVVVGGGICGFGGFYLATIPNSGLWNSAWINGFGWISVALVIFAKWNSAYAIFGSFLFGMLITLQSRKGNLADAFPQVFGWLSKLPDEFFQMLPFLITALVLIVSSIQQKKAGNEPSACGLNYFREER